MKRLLFFIISWFPLTIFGQTNIFLTNPEAEQVIKGNYNPSSYLQGINPTPPTEAAQLILNAVSPDSLKEILLELDQFKTRNSGSDTLSLNNGIGAARKWALQKFQAIANQSNNRLIPSYLQFDVNICNVLRHKNILAVLPGTDTANHQVVLVEGHIDSRCSNVCDTTCVAKGMEDNASGTALVLELARVMSKMTFKHSIVFMLTIGEEQGLVGADAFGDYVVNNNIPLKAVLNNDVIGGILCGETSSPPSCPGLNDVDSTNVRLFSFGALNSPSKQLARYIKLQYLEELKPLVPVKMNLHIMSYEDRVGRGGDHIPFRQKGYPAMRFTAANEHGDASNSANYTDRQHTDDDLLGVDTNGDSKIDSFFVDFNYLARNTVINGNALAQIANSPITPTYDITPVNKYTLKINITDNQNNYPFYRVAIRSVTNDWDSVYTINSKVSNIEIGDSNLYYISVASVNFAGIESLFGDEKVEIVLSEEEIKSNKIQLFQNKPNPFDEITYIPILVNDHQVKKGELKITNLNGELVHQENLNLQSGLNEIPYHHGFGATGAFIYSLFIEGKFVDSKTMIFAY